LSLAKVYGFWKPVTDIDRRELRAHLDTLYALLLRPRLAGGQFGGAAGT
jgi:hypothetical protein